MNEWSSPSQDKSNQTHATCAETWTVIVPRKHTSSIWFPFSLVSISGQIVDDEMNAILVQQLPRGARLTAIFDSCHSATALDLPYVYNEMGEPKKQKLNKLVEFLLNL